MTQMRYVLAMAEARTRSSGRQRGSIDELPSGALRVRVYAGVDPLTGRRHDLVEIVPPGPKAMQKAQDTRDRLVREVAERRNPRTNATVDQLLERYLEPFDSSTGHRTRSRSIAGTSATTSRQCSARRRSVGSTRRCSMRSTPSCGRFVAAQHPLTERAETPYLHRRLLQFRGTAAWLDPADCSIGMSPSSVAVQPR